MAHRVQIIPGILEGSKKEMVTRAEKFSFAPRIHLDVMDGDFVDAINWPYSNSDEWAVFEEMAQNKERLVQAQFEVHLMVSQPTRAGELFIELGATCVIAHIEAFRSEEGAIAAFETWRRAGAREVGISILLSTPIPRMEALLKNSGVDFIQVMGIENVGNQGQKFDERTLPRLQEIRERNPSLSLQIDGGAHSNNILSLVNAGATRIVVGSELTQSENPEEAYRTLLSLTGSEV